MTGPGLGMTDTSQHCPNTLREVMSPVRACGRRSIRPGDVTQLSSVRLAYRTIRSVVELLDTNLEILKPLNLEDQKPSITSIM